MPSTRRVLTLVGGADDIVPATGGDVFSEHYTLRAMSWDETTYAYAKHMGYTGSKVSSSSMDGYNKLDYLDGRAVAAFFPSGGHGFLTSSGGAAAVSVAADFLTTGAFLS